MPPRHLELFPVPMRPIHIYALMALIVAVPAATAGSFFGSTAKPCFAAGRNGYTFVSDKTANHVVRLDNSAAQPTLRLQLTEDPGAADFVLVDDTEGANACKDAARVESIRIDPAATEPELTVALSQSPAPYKIFVKSAHFTQQDAAALFAVIWQKARTNGALRSFARQD
jgi:hypothetical protein